MEAGLGVAEVSKPIRWGPGLLKDGQEVTLCGEAPLLPGLATGLLPSVHPQLVPPRSTEDVFPCKDCGIWYRSERNLQAHLLYYCASRQSAGSPATAATEEKPKESYPNERICPFPQCRKSCPSASSLEIHMRSHSGEPPPGPARP